MSLICRKSLITFFVITSHPCLAVSEQNPYDLEVKVSRSGANFHINASYTAALSQCEAFAFLTDYEDLKAVPGVVESKVHKRSGNKVTVERLIEEQVLLFPLQFRSVVEYTELPNQGLNFIQIKGNSKAYSGTWRLQSNEKGVQVKYASIIEPDSAIPSGVIEYFMKNNVRRSFEMMAIGMDRNREVLNLACR